MNELLVQAQLHRAALGMPGARASAAVFADRIDNPAVLGRVRHAVDASSGHPGATAAGRAADPDGGAVVAR